jgi:hypothetical protein
VVNDGAADSHPDAVTGVTENSPPVANAGADQSVLVGATVTLDGSGSTDVDGDPLTLSRRKPDRIRAGSPSRGAAETSPRRSTCS